MNYLEYKVLFCKQEEYNVFAIINIHDTLTLKDKVVAVSLPSSALTISDNIVINTDYELKANVARVFATAINSSDSTLTTYNLEANTAKSLMAKLKTSLVKMTIKHNCIILDGVPLYFKINELLSIYNTLNIDFTIDSPIRLSAESGYTTSTTYNVAANIYELIGTSINGVFNTNTTYNLNLTIAKYRTLYTLRNFTLNSMENQSLFNTGYITQ